MKQNFRLFCLFLVLYPSLFIASAFLVAACSRSSPQISSRLLKKPGLYRTSKYQHYRVSQFKTGGAVHDIKLFKDHRHALIAAYHGGVQYLDISRPLCPRLVSKSTFSNNAESLQLNKKETLAFVANGSAGLDILDISDPFKMRLLGRFDTPSYTFDVALSSDEKTVFLADNDRGVLVLDVSRAAHPRQISSIGSTTGTATLLIAQNGKRLFAADQSGGVMIIDVQNPSRPRLLSRIASPAQSQGMALSRNDQTLYVADNIGGLNIYGIKDLNQVKHLGHYPAKNAFSVTLIAGETQNKTALLADLYHGLHMVDVSDPMKPQTLLRIKTHGSVEKAVFAADTRTLYLADDQAGIKIIGFNK